MENIKISQGKLLTFAFFLVVVFGLLIGSKKSSDTPDDKVVIKNRDLTQNNITNSQNSGAALNKKEGATSKFVYSIQLPWPITELKNPLSSSPTPVVVSTDGC